MSSTGIMLALLSALLFGASTPIAKLLLGAINPWLLAGVLYLGAGAGLGIVTRAFPWDLCGASDAEISFR
jgi:drug/metabolite transporter (DMT)-like permease